MSDETNNPDIKAKTSNLARMLELQPLVQKLEQRLYDIEAKGHVHIAQINAVREFWEAIKALDKPASVPAPVVPVKTQEAQPPADA